MKRRLTVVMDVDETFYTRLAQDVADSPHGTLTFSAREFGVSTNVYTAPIVSLSHEVIAETQVTKRSFP